MLWSVILCTTAIAYSPLSGNFTSTTPPSYKDNDHRAFNIDSAVHTHVRPDHNQHFRSFSPRHKHWPAGPTHFSDRRASTFHLSLARTGHLDICRASRFQIVLARTMTNHSMYFSRGPPSHISAVFAQSFCYSETPAWRESESGMSIKHTDVSV